MELYIAPEKLSKNPLNGRFLKGHTPHNKGKKWVDYLDMRKARRMKKNLQKGRVGNSSIAGWNKRSVIGIKDGKIIGVFESASEAGRKTAINGRNISSCCNGKRKTCGGVQWFWESSNQWIELVNI